MKNVDMKLITIIVLTVAFIIVSILFINERNKQSPDKFQQIKEACQDISTSEKQSACAASLQDIQRLLDSIKTQ